MPPPEYISRYDFDKVVVTPAEAARLDITRQLMSLGVGKEKIHIYLPEAQRTWQSYRVVATDTGLRAQFDNISFDVIHSTDAMILDEIYLSLGYGLDIGTQTLTVFDIGMNVGLASLFFASRQNVQCVYGFEPLRPTYEGALHNFSLNDDTICGKIHPHCLGLSNHAGTLKLAYSADLPGGMSVFGTQDQQGEELQLVEAAEVLRPLLAQKHTDKVLLKIDTEGSEYDILSDLDQAGLLAWVDYILMETHMGKEELAYAILRKNHFAMFCEKGVLGLGMVKAVRME